MKKRFHGYCVASPRFAPWALAFLVAGCSDGASQTGEPYKPSAGDAPFGSGGPASSVAAGGTGTISSVGSSGASSGSVSSATNVGTGGSGEGNAGAVLTNPATGGSGGANGSGETNPAAGGTTATGVARTVELIGPGTARCGATNATHGDGFVCVLNYPSAGPNAVGYWFDYAFSAGTCNVAFTKPSGNSDPAPQVCFSGSACPASSGGGLGVALCDVHGIDVSTWPQLQMLETESSLSATVKSPFNGCNSGASMTAVSWTLGSGSIPAGASVLFDDAADVSVARIDNLAAGATSVDVPANVDTSKIATIKFSVSGATSNSWNFCLTSLTVSMR